MAKTRRSVLMFISVIALLSLCLTAFAGCSKDEKKETFTVTFMVRQDGVGDYQKYREVQTNEDGTVTLPEDPEVEGFSFRAWYTDEECTEANIFDGQKVENDMTVYAFMSDKVLNLSVKDETGKITVLKEQTVSSLDKVAADENEKAKAKNLIFVSWFTNEACTTKYENGDEATTLYGKYMADVVFYNGYEEITFGPIDPGSKIVKPDIDKIVKPYMSDKDIKFVNNDDNSVDFNFNSEIKENTVVRILWQTPNLEIKQIPDTDEYQVFGFDTKVDVKKLQEYPVISIPGEVTIENQKVKVSNVYAASFYRASGAKKILFNDGIKSIIGLSAGGASSPVEEVSLPQTLKILENCFNGYDNIKSIEIPEGLEIILDSFWGQIENGATVNRISGYENIKIEVPKSVNNISLVPANLVYSEGSPFYNDGDSVYKNDKKLGKVLVSFMQKGVTEGNAIIVPEGVKAIQVGTFLNLKYDFIEFPASFGKISYNNDRSNYPYYTGDRLLVLSSVSEVESNPKNKDVQKYAYTVIDDVLEHRYIKFNANSIPEGMNKYAFSNGGERYDLLDKNGNVVFVGKVEAGQPVDIIVNVYDPVTYKFREVSIDGFTSGSKITLDQIIEKAKINKESVGYNYSIGEVNQFGSKFDFEKEIDRNLYIDLYLVCEVKGFKVEENSDGTLIVTGFDKATAEALPNGVSYLVNITDVYNGKKIVAIADKAFKDNLEIGKVFIAPSVKVIGAEAFKGAKNLEFVNITGGLLETIGESAFEYAGAVIDNGKPIKNPQFTAGNIFLEIKLPLGTLKNLGPNAFNSPAIKEFKPSDNELEREFFYPTNPMQTLVENYEPFSFYFQKSMQGQFTSILKTQDNSIKKVKRGPEGSQEEFSVVDLDYCATAAGYNARTSLPLGFKDKMFGEKLYFRVTVKTGSIALYDTNVIGLNFALVKNVEKGAMTYLDDYFKEANKPGSDQLDHTRIICSKPQSIWATPEELSTTSPLFEEGWYVGHANAENTFMNDPSEGNNTPGFEF